MLSFSKYNYEVYRSQFNVLSIAWVNSARILSELRDFRFLTSKLLHGATTEDSHLQSRL